MDEQNSSAAKLEWVDPIKEADQALDAGRYGLIWGVSGGFEAPLGTRCHAPNPPDLDRSPIVAASLPIGVDGALSDPSGARLRYAEAYNRRVLSSGGHPYADVCVSGPQQSLFDAPLNTDRPATDRQPRRIGLATAARVGDRKAVSRMLPSADVDELDAFGMTALGWAVARGHVGIARDLLAAGADPLAGRTEISLQRTPLYLALAYGREPLFEAMSARRGGAPQNGWSAQLVEAAIVGGDPQLAHRLLARSEPLNERQLQTMVRKALEMGRLEGAAVVYESRRLSPAALLTAAVYAGEPTMIRRALADGVDPNAGDPPHLYRIASNGGVRAAEAAKELIAAGADVNAGEETPVEGLLRAGGVRSPAGENAPDEAGARLLYTLLEAGADVRKVDSRGRPVIIRALGVYAPDATPRAPPPGWLRMLVDAGADPHAPWRGRTALDYVVAAQGAEGPLAREVAALSRRRQPAQKGR
jgi:hypothetical protein